MAPVRMMTTASEMVWDATDLNLRRAAPVKAHIEVKFDRIDGGESGGILCQNVPIDAIVTMGNSKTYVFKGTEYWELADDGVASGYPRNIVDDWHGLPSNLDAAFTVDDGSTYFFKGSNYWLFNGMAADRGNPRSISEGFPGIPDNIDTVVVWSGNRRIYFFKGSSYWRYEPSDTPPVTDDYPAPISNWNVLPNNLDGALLYSNGYNYFKDGQYWRYNDTVNAPDADFPRPAGYWWFGCPAFL